MNKYEQVVRDYLKMIEERFSVEELDRFYHPDVIQIEYPNVITKKMAIRTLSDLKAAAERGKAIMQKEEFEIKNIFSINEIVIIECIWKGTLAVPIGNIKKGEQMIANFAQIFEFKDDKIIKQRNYDCFEPFI